MTDTFTFLILIKIGTWTFVHQMWVLLSTIKILIGKIYYFDNKIILETINKLIKQI